MLMRGLESFRAVSADGCQLVIPVATISRSTCLQTIFDSSDAELSIPLPFAWVRAWLSFVSGTPGDSDKPDQLPVRELLQVLQARHNCPADVENFNFPLLGRKPQLGPWSQSDAAGGGQIRKANVK